MPLEGVLRKLKPQRRQSLEGGVKELKEAKKPWNGGMVPYFEHRIIGFHDFGKMRRRSEDKLRLTKSPIEYFKMFYKDTAIYGSTLALRCREN